MKKLTEKKLRAFCDRSALDYKHSGHLIGRGDWTIAHNGHVMVLAPSSAGIAPDPCDGCGAPELETFERILGEDWRGAWQPVESMAKDDPRVRWPGGIHLHYVEIGAAHVNFPYWNLIAALPGAEIAITDQTDTRIRFRAAHGIIGAVMPLRQ